MVSDSSCSIFKLFLWLSAWQCRPGLFIYCHLYIFVSCFLVFSIVNSSTISHDTQRGGGAKWRHIIQYLRQQNIQDIIIKLTYFHSSSKIKKLWLTSQDTSPLLNKVTRAPSYILIGQTRSANSSHGLPKYLMIHLPFCSINVTYVSEWSDMYIWYFSRVEWYVYMITSVRVEWHIYIWYVSRVEWHVYMITCVRVEWHIYMICFPSGVISLHDNMCPSGVTCIYDNMCLYTTCVTVSLTFRVLASWLFDFWPALCFSDYELVTFIKVNLSYY
jgi:hypothetical protein